MIDYAYEVKQAVSMRQACEMYGFSVNRAGFICCPFHGEKTASMKIYPADKGYHCFGCGKGGDVINFVQELYGLDYKATVRKINDDFCLRLPLDEKLSDKQQREAEEKVVQRKREVEARQRAVAEAQARYDAAADRLTRLDKVLTKTAKKGRFYAITEEEADALRNISLAEFEVAEAEAALYRLRQQYQ